VKRLLLLINILAAAFIVNAQIIKPVKARGIEFGCNIAPFVVQIINPAQKGMEFTLNVEVIKNLVLSTEAGILSINEEKDLFTYQSTGSFIRAGFDYNIYKKNLPKEHNQILVGIKYGVARFEHEAASISIVDVKWGNYHGSFPKTSGNAQWIEFNGGVKAEIFRNFSIGWMAQINYMINTNGMSNVKPYLIAGFGKGNKTLSVGYSYSLFYRIPLF
jgi:hypothetical protein